MPKTPFQQPEPKVSPVDDPRVFAPRGVKVCPCCRAEYLHGGDDCGAADNKHVAFRNQE